MTNLWINIRIFRLFIQLDNRWHMSIKPALPSAQYTTPLAVYQFFGW